MIPPLPIHLQADELGHSLRRLFIDSFQLCIAGEWPSGARVLDLGGTRLAKRGLFDIERFGFRVVYANLSAEKKPHVLADAARLPFREEAFDAVICAELLEHVYRPEEIVREAHRALKPGGKLLITVPFLVGIHADPHDYGRYTDSYWRRLLEEAGFRITCIERQGGIGSVLFDMLRSWTLDRRERGEAGLLTRVAEWGIRRGRRRALQPSNVSASDLSSRFTTGYGIVAIKVAEGAAR